MSRTTDAEIGHYANNLNILRIGPEILAALKAERARADAAEEEATELACLYPDATYGWRARRAICTLWKSRRMWQDEARKYFRFFLAECKVAESERKRADKAEVRIDAINQVLKLYDLTEPVEQLAKAEKTLARVRQFAHEMRGYCSPMGISVHYASQLEDVLDGRA